MNRLQVKGLTLIEILIAMGIATMVGVLLLVIIVGSAGLFTTQSSKVSEGLDINAALSNMRGSIKQASAVVSSYDSGVGTYTTSASQLVLKVASVDALNNLIDNTYDFFVFFLDGNTLHFRTFPNPSSSRKPVDQIFSTSVDRINFQYFNSANPPAEVLPPSASKVRISLTLKQHSATSEANLRND